MTMVTNMSKRTIPAGEFKAHCLKLMDEVAATGDEIVITKRGKPVAQLVRAGLRTEPESLFGYMKGTFEIIGDIVEPIFPNWEGTERWDRLERQLAEEAQAKKRRMKKK